MNRLLPVFLSASQLNLLIRAHYERIYPDRITTVDFNRGEEDCLSAWEREVLDRYNIHSGRMLVIGSGFGRESLAIAKRGVRVIGIDTNYMAVQAVNQWAQKEGIKAFFHQANLFNLPYAPASFDFVLLLSSMYSVIPGALQRRAWLADLGRLLKPDGLVVLSFRGQLLQVKKVEAFGDRLNRILIKIPGANTAYQPGDGCVDGHFFHTFQTEQEIRDEFTSAGAIIRELSWALGFAIVAYTPRHN